MVEDGGVLADGHDRIALVARKKADMAGGHPAPGTWLFGIYLGEAGSAGVSLLLVTGVAMEGA